MRVQRGLRRKAGIADITDERSSNRMNLGVLRKEKRPIRNLSHLNIESKFKISISTYRSKLIKIIQFFTTNLAIQLGFFSLDFRFFGVHFSINLLRILFLDRINSGTVFLNRQMDLQKFSTLEHLLAKEKRVQLELS